MDQPLADYLIKGELKKPNQSFNHWFNAVLAGARKLINARAKLGKKEPTKRMLTKNPPSMMELAKHMLEVQEQTTTPAATTTTTTTRTTTTTEEEEEEEPPHRRMNINQRYIFLQLTNNNSSNLKPLNLFFIELRHLTLSDRRRSHGWRSQQQEWKRHPRNVGWGRLRQQQQQQQQ